MNRQDLIDILFGTLLGVSAWLIFILVYIGVGGF